LMEVMVASMIKEEIWGLKIGKVQSRNGRILWLVSQHRDFRHLCG